MNIIPYNFDGSEIRAISQNGNPWFVAKDSAEAAKIIWNGSQTLGAIDEEDKAMLSLPDAMGRMQSVWIISEAGLNTLILRSQDAIIPGTPAHRFKKWVTSEVLPQIRKTGGYHLPQTFPEALRLLADAAEENEALKLTVAAQQPAVEFVDKYVKAEGLFGIRQTAKILGLQQNAFVKMCEGEILFREGGYLVPYSEWITAGYCHVKTGEANGHSFPQTRFTSKGIEWVRRKLAIAALLGEDQKAA